METTPDLRSYACQYMAAKNELAAGRKDTGLRILWALRYHLNQTPTEDTDTKRLKKLVDTTAALWGTGFDWN
jgi:hypothetical protein